MKIVSFASILGVASANKVECKMTANDKITKVTYNGQEVHPWWKNSHNTDDKWRGTTYKFDEIIGASLVIQAKDSTWNGGSPNKMRDDKTGAFSMKCTAGGGSSWNGFKSNTKECINGTPHPKDVGLCETEKKLSFAGQNKQNRVDVEYRIWHCGREDKLARATIKCAPATASPTAFPTASPTKFPTASPTASPTSSPTQSPTQSPTAHCDASNCMNWNCADWCECYDEEHEEIYASLPGCQDDGDDSCVCFQEEDDEFAKQIHEGTTRHDKMHYRQYQKHKVVCGRHNPRECNEADRWETDKAAKHEVRCCSDVAPTNALKNLRNMKNCANPHNPGPSVSRVGHRLPGIQGVWGMSKVGNTGDKCVHSATFDEAEAICAAIPNGRMCTEEELKAECTSGTGCMHDFDLVWVKPQMVGVDTRPVQEEAAPVDPVQFMGCYNQDQIPGWSQWSCAPDADTFYVNCNRLGGSHDAMVEQCANTCRSRGATQFDIHDRTACFCGTANNEAIVSPPITDLYDPGCKNYLYRLN